MDYFRQLSSALARGGGALPGVTLGNEVESYNGKGIWKLYDGVRKVGIYLMVGRSATCKHLCVGYDTGDTSPNCHGTKCYAKTADCSFSLCA